MLFSTSFSILPTHSCIAILLLMPLSSETLVLGRRWSRHNSKSSAVQQLGTRSPWDHDDIKRKSPTGGKPTAAYLPFSQVGHLPLGLNMSKKERRGETDTPVTVEDQNKKDTRIQQDTLEANHADSTVEFMLTKA